MPYIAISKVRHNGDYYKVGEEVLGLDKKQAERLLELGVIEGDSAEGSKPKKQVSGNAGADV